MQVNTWRVFFVKQQMIEKSKRNKLHFLYLCDLELNFMALKIPNFKINTILFS